MSVKRKPSGLSEGELASGQERPAWAVHVNQTTFEHFLKCSKSAAIERTFSTSWGDERLMRPAAIAFQQGLKFRLVLEESQFGLPLELQRQAGQQNGPDGHLRTG